MDLSTKKVDAVTVVTVIGEINAATSSMLQELLEEQQAEDRHQLLVDLGQAPYVSSAGLRVLLGGLKVARRSGGDLRLLGLQGPVREVFDIAGFSTLFKIYEDMEGALGSFAPL
jgi:anti-sigma B factor antagonist